MRYAEQIKPMYDAVINSFATSELHSTQLWWLDTAGWAEQMLLLLR